MKLRNVKVPEGINVSRHNPLVDLVLLGGGLILGFAILSAVLLWLGGALARHMPVAWENAVVDQFFDHRAPAVSEPQGKIVAELQALADRLALHMALDPEARVIVHYLDHDQVNAFATLGGHIFVMRGLIERMPHENALAMVLAHEIAHQANRDPAAQLGGGLLLQAVLSLFLANGPETLGQILYAPEALVQRGFSRDAEDAADAAALAAVAAHYGHVAGAETLFEVLLEAQGGDPDSELIELLQTHPLDRSRIEAIADRASHHGWSQSGPTTPLSPALRDLRASYP